MKHKVKVSFLTIFSIIILCIGLVIKELQNDTFYMIKLGEYIFSNGIDLLDHWSWISKLSYTYPHWLYDVFIFGIYDLFGFFGVYISSIFFFIILILLIYFVQLKVNKSWFMALLVSIISIVCLYGFATARAQLLTVILFFLEIIFIEKLINSGKKKYILGLTILSLLIANLHTTIWLFYFILYLPFVTEHIIYKLKKTKLFNKKFSCEKITIQKIIYFKELIISMIFTFLMGIFTPSRICYSYVFKVMMGSSQNYITEHAPLIIIQHPCFLVFLFILLLLLIFSSNKIKLRELFMICGLTVMSLLSVRHLIFFYTIGLFYISKLCIRYLNNKKDKSLDILGNILISNNIIYILFIVLISIISFCKFQQNQELSYINKEKYPIMASSFIKENLDLSTIRLYNDYNYGSYLMFQDIPVFIDSRCDLYLKEFNNLSYSIFDDNIDIKSNYQKKFEFYNFTHILIPKKNLFYQILSDRDEYKVLYQDKYFILFERGYYE